MITAPFRRASQLNVIVEDVVAETLKLFGGDAMVKKKILYIMSYCIYMYDYAMWKNFGKELVINIMIHNFNYKYHTV